GIAERKEAYSLGGHLFSHLGRWLCRSFVNVYPNVSAPTGQERRVARNFNMSLLRQSFRIWQASCPVSFLQRLNHTSEEAMESLLISSRPDPFLLRKGSEDDPTFES